DIGLVADHPAIVSGHDVEEVACPHFEFGAIIHDHHDPSRHDQPDMFDFAGMGTCALTNVLGPFPAGLISGPADGHAADVDQLEDSLLEAANFIRRFEALEQHTFHGSPSRDSGVVSLSKKGPQKDSKVNGRMLSFLFFVLTFSGLPAA